MFTLKVKFEERPSWHFKYMLKQSNSQHEHRPACNNFLRTVRSDARPSVKHESEHYNSPGCQLISVFR